MFKQFTLKMGWSSVCTAVKLEMIWFLGLVSHVRNLINLSPGVPTLLHKRQFSLKVYLFKDRSGQYKSIKVKCGITALLQYTMQSNKIPHVLKVLRVNPAEEIRCVFDDN